jgi:uncharacterized protein (TIGR02145 family)
MYQGLIDFTVSNITEIGIRIDQRCNSLNKNRMKKLSSFLILFFGLVWIVVAQTVKIGTQVWMTKNLDVTTFRNGDPIQEVQNMEEWVLAGKNGQPAWCYYDNNSFYGDRYGKLYNWYAVNDPRGLAPQGYYIPSENDWKILMEYFGGQDVAGQKIKNINGLNGLNGGFRGGIKGTFHSIEYGDFWWSSTAFSNNSAFNFQIVNDRDYAGKVALPKGMGMSVRCIMY